MEIWKSIVGHEGLYEISNLGNIRRTGGSTLVQANTKGYRVVTLYKNGSRKMHYVHRLVLQTFVGAAPQGHQGCHCDGVRSHNALFNLRWGTPLDNTADKIRHGTWTHGEGHHKAKVTNRQVADILASSESANELGAEMGLRPALIRRIRRGETWCHVAGERQKAFEERLAERNKHIKRQMSEGATVGDIIAKYGLCRSSVYAIQASP